MKVQPSIIPDVLIIDPDAFPDNRGFFLESWNLKRYSQYGLDADFLQDSHSRSHQNVLRGLHYQLKKPQGKLVRVTSGIVFDVAVDIRRGSPTFAQWVGIELSDENHRQVYIPAGFAHGFCVLSHSADFVYKCTDYYTPDDEYGILWSDPEIGIAWPGNNFNISKKDAGNNLLNTMGDRLPIYSKL
jgi:dTDP-4-dehydrorhamnose 3,5-epimerase